MFRKFDTDILVVGSGPVGLFAALRLTRCGLNVRIIDQQRRPGGRSYALALHERSLELLREAGFAEELLAESRPLDSLAFYRRGEKLQELDASILVIPQQKLEDLLVWHLGQAGVEVRWGHRLTGLREESAGFRADIERLEFDEADTARVQENRTWRARYVLGTDGHTSAVRGALGIAFPVVGPSLPFLVFEFQAPAKLSQARIGLDGSHVNVLWPLGGGRFRWSFQVEPSALIGPRVKKARERDHREEGLDLHRQFGLQHLEDLHAGHAGMFESSVEILHWSAAATFQQRWATTSRRGTGILLGDAAHITTPVGVHSMNAGLREAAELAEALCKILTKGGDEMLLTQMVASSRTEWRRVAAIDSFSALPHAPKWVAPYAPFIPSWLPASGPRLDAMLFKLGVG